MTARLDTLCLGRFVYKSALRLAGAETGRAPRPPIVGRGDSVRQGGKPGEESQPPLEEPWP